MGTPGRKFDRQAALTLFLPNSHHSSRSSDSFVRPMQETGIRKMSLNSSDTPADGMLPPPPGMRMEYPIGGPVDHPAHTRSFAQIPTEAPTPRHIDPVAPSLNPPSVVASVLDIDSADDLGKMVDSVRIHKPTPTPTPKPTPATKPTPTPVPTPTPTPTPTPMVLVGTNNAATVQGDPAVLQSTNTAPAGFKVHVEDTPPAEGEHLRVERQFND